MEESVVRIVARNSELVVAKEQRAFLGFPAEGLADCRIEESEDGVEFVFETSGLSPAGTVLPKPLEERLRFLVNCAGLDRLNSEYEFSLSPDNLMVDINMTPRVLRRDTPSGAGATFMVRYVALVASVLQQRYKYKDYLLGGVDLYKKNALVDEVASMDDVGLIRNRLAQEYERVTEEIGRTKHLVPRRNVWASRVAIPSLSVALVVAAFFLWSAEFRDIPYRDAVVAANSAYIKADYIGSQRALDGYGLTELSVDSRYLLARAYVATEALTDSQRQNVLTGLTPKTDPVIFDYWILVGRMQFPEAIDIAQRLGDDELLLFAYLKYEVAVRGDATMSGEAKTQLLVDLEAKISSLQKARDDAAQQPSGPR